MPVGKKCPLKTVALGKKITEWLKTETVANHSAMGWAESIKWAIVHGRVRDDVEKKM